MAVTVTKARQRSFPGTADQVRQARDWVRALLPAPCPKGDEVVLVVSELVTNAIVHSVSGLAGGVFLVRVEVDSTARSVALTVVDQGVRPVPARRDPGASGWGLGDIVAALADAYEVTVTPAGRTTWCRVDWAASAATSPTSSREGDDPR